MIRSTTKTIFQAVCDKCGAIDDVLGDESASTPDEAVEYVLGDADWQKRGAELRCYDCWSADGEWIGDDIAWRLRDDDPIDYHIEGPDPAAGMKVDEVTLWP